MPGNGNSIGNRNSLFSPTLKMFRLEDRRQDDSTARAHSSSARDMPPPSSDPHLVSLGIDRSVSTSTPRRKKRRYSDTMMQTPPRPSRGDNRHFAEPTKTEVRLRKERDGFRRELTGANKKIQRLRGERNEARVKVESLEAALEATQQKIREYEISSNRSSDNILSIGSVSSYDSYDSYDSSSSQQLASPTAKP